MKKINVVKFGALVVRKLILYAIVVVLSMLMISWATALMSIANTLAFLGGIVLAVVTLGLIFTFILREILFYTKKFSDQ